MSNLHILAITQHTRHPTQKQIIEQAMGEYAEFFDLMEEHMGDAVAGVPLYRPEDGDAREHVGRGKRMNKAQQAEADKIEALEKKYQAAQDADTALAESMSRFLQSKMAPAAPAVEAKQSDLKGKLVMAANAWIKGESTFAGWLGAIGVRPHHADVFQLKLKDYLQGDVTPQDLCYIDGLSGLKTAIPDGHAVALRKLCAGMMVVSSTVGHDINFN